MAALTGTSVGASIAVTVPAALGRAGATGLTGLTGLAGATAPVPTALPALAGARVGASLTLRGALTARTATIATVTRGGVRPSTGTPRAGRVSGSRTIGPAGARRSRRRCGGWRRLGLGRSAVPPALATIAALATVATVATRLA